MRFCAERRAALDPNERSKAGFKMHCNNFTDKGTATTRRPASLRKMTQERRRLVQSTRAPASGKRRGDQTRASFRHYKWLQKSTSAL